LAAVAELAMALDDQEAVVLAVDTRKAALFADCKLAPDPLTHVQQCKQPLAHRRRKGRHQQNIATRLGEARQRAG